MVSRRNDRQFQKALSRIEGTVRNGMFPVALAGSIPGFVIKELFSKRFYPLWGGTIAAFSLVLSVEAYWVGLGGGSPFIPKLGFSDGADLMELFRILQSNALSLFIFLALMSVLIQVCESVPWRLKNLNRRAARKSLLNKIPKTLLWILVAGCYALDIYSVWQSYRVGGITLPTVIWAGFCFIGPELGFALQELGKARGVE